MPTLILLRHAKAEASGVGSAGTDIERELAQRGREQARAAAQLLVDHGLVPDIVLCSAAVRTRQTWEGISAELPGKEAGPGRPWAPPGGVYALEELYAARPSVVHELVRDHGVAASDGLAPAGTMLVVGHEPIMSMTASQYADATSDRAAMFSVQAGMSTASMAVIDLAGWEARSGRLRALIRT